MKVLVIGSRIPFPLHDGGAIATYNMLKGLSDNGVEITYISLNTSKHFTDEATINREFGFLKAIRTFNIHTGISVMAAFKNLFSSTSYNIERFYNTDFEQILVDAIQSSSYDIIHFEGLFVAKYIHKIRSASSAPALLRQHNIEFRIWERLAQNEGNPLKKWYLGLLAKRIKVFETDITPFFDRIVTIAPTDELIMKKWPGIKSLETIPGGLLLPERNKNIKIIPHSVYHIGSMEWLPNRQAMEWFHRSVWPLIIKDVPTALFFMAGKNMPESYKQWTSDTFQVSGEVPDASIFAADKEILIVPLLSASGIRIKTIEAMLQRKAVVTTAIGAAGLPIEDGKDCLIANSAEDFAKAVIQLLQFSDKRNKMAENGYKLMAETYEINAVAQRWIAIYKSMTGQ